MFWLMCIGFVLEFSGLLLAACGLLRTWRDNRGDRKFFPAWIRRVPTWLRVKIFRREPRPVEVHAGTAAFSREGHSTAEGYAPQSLSDTMDIDEKIAAVQSNALRAFQSASLAHTAILVEHRGRTADIAALGVRIDGTEKTMISTAQSLILRVVVDGIPLAVLGLGLAAVGLLLQAFATVTTFGGAS